MILNHKKWNLSHDFFCIELKLGTVVALITKFHDMATETFLWQHNGASLSFPFKRYLIRVFLLQNVLFALVVHSVGVHVTATKNFPNLLLWQ